MITNLRSVFCGYQTQHDKIFASARDFMVSSEPGLFIIGGTNLTGKTRLINRIKDNGPFSEFNFLNPTENGSRYYIEKLIGFNDEDGRPQPITVEDIYGNKSGKLKEVPFALEHGVRTIFLDEAWAGHIDALDLVYRELVQQHHAKVLLDVVSSHEGSGFFDNDANNSFIGKSVLSCLPDAKLHLLNFNLQALYDGVLEIARESRDFETDMRPQFPRDQRVRLNEARIQGQLERELSNMISWKPRSGIEAKNY